MSNDSSPNQGNGGGSVVNPASLSVEDMSRILSSSGGRKVTAEQVQADVDGGAPVGKDSRINLVHYAAWLMREVQGEGSR